MTHIGQVAETDTTETEKHSLLDSPADATAETEEQAYRSGAYSLLARVLRSPPDQEVLDQIAGFSGIDSQQDQMMLAMSMLGLAATTTPPATLDDEFHALFIGIGRGELVPYGSWYQTGYLMERPLGRLRDDLMALGFQRQEGVKEPEDHVAALCEVMAILIGEGASLQRQSHFFNTHLADWMRHFFNDLSEAGSAVFYRAVGRFGNAFMALEQRYLNMPV
jgi:TorA maturation chaperone TorD